MKPKAPKKKDIKPNAKGGALRQREPETGAVRIIDIPNAKELKKVYPDLFI